MKDVLSEEDLFELTGIGRIEPEEINDLGLNDSIEERPF